MQTWPGFLILISSQGEVRLATGWKLQFGRMRAASKLPVSCMLRGARWWTGERERSHEDDGLLVARDPLLEKNTQLRAVNQLPRCNLSLNFEGELVRERIWYQGRLNTRYTSLLKDAWWTCVFLNCFFNSHLRPGNHSPSDSRKMNKSACLTTLVTRHGFVPHVTNSLTQLIIKENIDIWGSWLQACGDTTRLSSNANRHKKL